MRELAKIFQSLSDVNRIRILKMLETRPLCVCEITSVLGLATSTVSRHLSILRDAGFVTDAKEGKWVNYRLAESASGPYINKLLPVLKGCLPEDEVVRQDREKVLSVDRESICA
ncbi:MAG: ArsR/SmtB family transcription factor [Thermodesulfobacteriota bacterium]